MKAMKTLILTVTLLTTVAGLAIAAGPRRGGGWGSGIALEPLTQTEIDHVIYMREEEKLARDVYMTMAETRDCPVFANISMSEQRHMDAVKNLIYRRGLVDPVVSDERGAFTNPELQALYYELVAAGSESLEAGLEAGRTIELLDIEDLAAALDDVTAADVTRLLENLMAGSTRHLAAFEQALDTGCPGTCDGNGTCNLGQGKGKGGQGNGNGQQTRQRKRDGSCLATL